MMCFFTDTIHEVINMDLGDMKSKDLGQAAKSLVEMGKDILNKAEEEAEELKDKMMDKIKK